jgi:stress response protein YsnF
MPDQEPVDQVIPVVSEEVHADAVPVETGAVRVTKRVEGHDEIIQQEVRKGRVEVKRVAVNRPVDGPQSPRREGNTLVVPVVSEILKIEKQWIITEEIYLTQLEETQTVREKVQVNQEVAEVERVDQNGQLASRLEPPKGRGRVLNRAETPKEPRRRILTERTERIVKNS